MSNRALTAGSADDLLPPLVEEGAMRPHHPRVLVVEDEFLIALALQETLEGFGCRVLGPIARLGEAIAEATAGDMDAAILDLVLDGKPSDPVAEALSVRGIPFGFASGMNPYHADARWRTRPFIAKPYSIADLRDFLRQLLPGHAKLRPCGEMGM
jgi:chemotaxis family two-component system sensor kinase Cph1